MRAFVAAAFCTAAAHAAVLHETVVAVPGALIVSITTAPGTAPDAILLPLPAPAVATAADPDALHALLAATAPRLTARFDPDPCFAHPATSPPPPAQALAALPGTPVPVAFQSFAAPSPELRVWLHAHGVSAGGPPPAGPVLALVIPADATAAPVRLDFAKSVPSVPLIASATVLLVGSGPLSLQGITAAPTPSGAVLPEFVYSQFGHVFEAMLRAASTPAILDYAATLPSGFGTRFELRNPPSGLTPIVPAPDAPALQPVFSTRIGWKGEYTLACTQGFAYRRELTTRWQAENKTLEKLTGWRAADIRQTMVVSWQQSVAAQEGK